MNDIFNTTTIRFNVRSKFDLAVLILQKLENEMGENLIDVGHADMIISVFSDVGWNWVRGELDVHQIWSVPSFHGAADYEIVEN